MAIFTTGRVRNNETGENNKDYNDSILFELVISKSLIFGFDLLDYMLIHFNPFPKQSCP